MKHFFKYIDNTSIYLFLVASLSLGLAPFVPMPHIVEKLMLLFSGSLTKGIDIFDLLFHGTPWLLLITKIIRMLFYKKAVSQN